MFQRLRGELRGAFDTIADEQNRLRAQQAAAVPAQRSGSQSRPQGARPTRPKVPVTDLVGPDPDPTQFVVGDEDSAATPDPTKVNEPIPDSLSQDASTSREGGVEVEPGAASATANGTVTPGTTEESAEVQAKLRKLEKLESKYSDLLKAYRRAHARNSYIEPFEARLRETTPLTSITDPAAFVEYVSQLSTKGDMVMDELKKVSGDRDGLKKKLEEAEQETKAAYDEMAQLKEQHKGEADDVEPKAEPEIEAATPPTASPKVASPRVISLGKGLFSPKQKPASATEEPNGDLFSVEDEVPKLQAELQERAGEIEQMHSQSQLLKDELSTARESAEQMMRDLEKAQQELESKETLHAKSDEDTEHHVTELKEKIADLEVQISNASSKLANAKSEIDRRDVTIAELSQVSAIVDKLQERVDNGEISHPDVPVTNDGPAKGPVIAEAPTDTNESAAKKKKNKKKKKKSGAVLTSGEQEDEPAASEVPTGSATNVSNQTTTTTSVSTEIEKLLSERDATIDRLHSKLKPQEDLQEEIESLREELLSLGQEHVEAKEKIKQLQAEKVELEKKCLVMTEQLDSGKSSGTAKDLLLSQSKEAAGKAAALEKEKAELQSRVKTMEGQISALTTKTNESVDVSRAQAELSKNFEDLKSRSKALESDLTAAQQLATSRYKEMASLRELLAKAQPEVTALRSEVTELKAARDELTFRSKDIRKLELREESLRSELDALKKEASSKDSDLSSLRQKVTQETSSRIAAEETNRKAQRDLQRAQTEASNATSARDTISSQLTNTSQQLEQSQNKLQQLERQIEQLKSESDTLRDEISLKSAQHASAESLMRSVRDQASEMGTQMKEARERCESLEEELNDAHRLMSERGREGETMRRLLSEVEQRAETRVKEMRERLEIAVQERDRAEDEASSAGRRRTREVEEVRGKLKDAERDVRRVKDDKEDLERIERDLRRQKEDDRRRIEDANRELEEVRRAMAELRDALDDGERQTRDFEVERNELKKSLDEAQQRVEKLQKSNKTLTDDLRTLRATRMRPGESPSQSSRSSFESTRRVASPSTGVPTLPFSPSNASLRGSISSQSVGSIDYVYLKNVLLQFLEQKDKGHQMQLVPVLSMLLKFDKRDEQKWTAAISAR